MKRDKLKDAMARRSPLTQREPVDPVDLYTAAAAAAQPDVPGETTSFQQTDKGTSGEVDIATSQHVDMMTSQPGNPGETLRRRYTTYLKPETIKAIKWLAVDGERNDYEIVQEALDAYLRHAKQ